MSINTKGSSSPGGKEKPKARINCLLDTDHQLPQSQIVRNSQGSNCKDEQTVELEKAKKAFSILKPAPTINTFTANGKEHEPPSKDLISKIDSTSRSSQKEQQKFSLKKLVLESKNINTSAKNESEEKPPTESKSQGEPPGRDSERAMYQEKQSNYRVDFSKVRSLPKPSRESWWYPDPYTGYYVPEDHFGEVSPAPPEQKSKKPKPQTKSPLLGKHGWWTSMEDLPDSLN